MNRLALLAVTGILALSLTACSDDRDKKATPAEVNIKVEAAQPSPTGDTNTSVEVKPAGQTDETPASN